MIKEPEQGELFYYRYMDKCGGAGSTPQEFTDAFVAEVLENATLAKEVAEKAARTAARSEWTRQGKRKRPPVGTGQQLEFIVHGLVLPHVIRWKGDAGEDRTCLTGYASPAILILSREMHLKQLQGQKDAYTEFSSMVDAVIARADGNMHIQISDIQDGMGDGPYETE